MDHYLTRLGMKMSTPWHAECTSHPQYSYLHFNSKSRPHWRIVTQILTLYGLPSVIHPVDLVFQGPSPTLPKVASRRTSCRTQTPWTDRQVRMWALGFWVQELIGSGLRAFARPLLPRSLPAGDSQSREGLKL